MASYICWHCGTAFDDETAGEEINIHKEVHPWFVERFIACPACGSTRYEDAVKCRHCKRPFRLADLRGGWYCDECLAEITDTYHEHEFIKAEIDCYADWLHERRQRNEADNVIKSAV